MKTLVVHEASGRIKSVLFVADGAGYEGESEERVMELEPGNIGLTMERGERLDSERLHEHAKAMVENFRVVQGTIVRR